LVHFCQQIAKEATRRIDIFFIPDYYFFGGYKMKSIFFTVAILFAAALTVFAQQTSAIGATNRPTSAQTRDSASQFLNQAKTNSTQFDTNQSDLNTRNAANADSHSFDTLKKEIERLETQITDIQNRSANNLNGGSKLNQDSLDRIQRLLDQHKAKIAELEAFVAGR
jgi:septal ring factor EnvC (AmiA/AmiB activator)